MIFALKWLVGNGLGTHPMNICSWSTSACHSEPGVADLEVPHDVAMPPEVFGSTVGSTVELSGRCHVMFGGGIYESTRRLRLGHVCHRKPLRSPSYPNVSLLRRLPSMFSRIMQS